jgi:hypothetical protein
MSAAVIQADRRAIPRFNASTIRVNVRIPGKLGTSSGRLIDFNRYGLAVCLAGSSALITAKTSLVALSFNVGRFHVHNALGVIHNRYRLQAGERLGIRFRVDAPSQLDAAAMRHTLSELEQALQNQMLEQLTAV